MADTRVLQQTYEDLMHEYIDVDKTTSSEFFVKPFVDLHIRRRLEELCTSYIRLSTNLAHDDPFRRWLNEETEDMKNLATTFSSKSQHAWGKVLLAGLAAIGGISGIGGILSDLGDFCYCIVTGIVAFLVVPFLSFLLVTAFRKSRDYLLASGADNTSSQKQLREGKSVYELEARLFGHIGAGRSSEPQFDVLILAGVTGAYFVAWIAALVGIIPHHTVQFLIYGILAGVITVSAWNASKRRG